jgi:hypothetical protein
MIFKFFRALGGALLIALATSGIADPAAAAQRESATVTYRLPMQGPLPRTYRVTLAITADDDPNWIISTFVSGAVRTVTAENKGEFTESWNGLDDNFMPVPPGRYGVKGIYMPAQKWEVTGEFHSLIPKLAVAAGDSWFPTRRDDLKTPWTNTAGFGTMTDIAIGKNGEAVFLHSYLENALNPYVVDLNRPIGDGQILRAYRSGGTAGGEAVATDGELVWAVSPQGRGGSDFIYRADEKPFGHDRSMYRDNVFVVPGKVTSLAAWRDPQTGARFLYVAERNTPSGLLILDGNTGDMLEEMPVTDAQAVTTDGSALFVLHRLEGGKWVVDRLSLRNGRPAGRWGRWLTLASIAHPADVKVNHQGRTFVSDASANQVYEFDRNGRLLRHFGRAAVQRAGHYDPQVFMSPNKLALWTDRRGEERLLVVERAGPGRISEWSPGGKLLRQWFPGQVGAVFGYAIDPEDPRHVYMPSSAGSGVIRFHVDYGTGAWRVDAVWPDIAKSNGCPGGLSFPKIVNTHGHKYLTFARTHEADEPCGYMIYRLDGDRFIPAAGLVRPAPVVEHVEPSDFLWWNDANGDGKIDPPEYRGRPGKLPTRMNYWGDHWLDDLSLVTLENGGQEAWRIAPSGFDRHGNPIFDGARWKQILVDPIIAGLTAGQVDPRRGGNELLPGSDNSWMDAEGTTQSGFFAAASTGPPWPDGLDSAGRIASQVKLSRYVPDGSGGYRLLWRVGRKATSILQTGEMYSALHVSAAPINGMVAVQDGNGFVHVFTDGGLYVDTLFFDVYRGGNNAGGVYALNGELFDGYAFLNREDGKVYIAIGRDAVTIYEVKGWTKSSRIAFPITALSREVILTAGTTAPAPEFALRMRTGQPAARIAVLEPATGGGPSLDGSLDGWSRATPLSFGLDDEHRVEIHALYDPDTLYLRAHLRLPRAPQAAPADAIERIFTDSIGADTFSFYIQGDPLAQGSDANGRSGDARFVFGLVRSGQGVQPVVVGMYPERHGGGGPEHRASYDSPVGHVEFADVAIVRDARLGYRIDDDERGFVIAAALPRRAIPAAASFGSSGFLHTTLDFEATLGGKTKFWWSNLDRAASTITSDVPSEARFYPGAWGSAQFVPLDGALSAGSWLVSGPWGGPGRAAIEASASAANPGPWASAIQKFYEASQYPPDDQTIDPQAVYEGPLSLDGAGSSHRIAWQVRRSDPGLGDMRLGDPGRLYYAAQWIWSPDDRQVGAEFLYERQDMIKAWLNGAALADATYLPPRRAQEMLPGWSRTLSLRAGWNVLFLRAFAVGYDLRIGLRLHDRPERLWQLRLAPTPAPQATGDRAVPGHP